MMTPSNIILPEAVENHGEFLGAKTLNLKKCLDWGFVVPAFVAVPTYICAKLLTSQVLREKISEEAQAVLPNGVYTVRSSALVEDGKNQSLAGQFFTKINVRGDELSQAMFEVVQQAEAVLPGQIHAFSIIIQQYISPDISGVTFTRNPSGGREMVLEYGFGAGEALVSGHTKPQKICLYWYQQLDANSPASFINQNIIKQFKELEYNNNFPQDVEWCIKDNCFYILQTRPITTISQKQYAQMRFLDDELPKDRQYYFAKTEISEVTPRPAPLTYDLLNLIYAKDGPVSNVYKKYGVAYEPADFLKIIGNELFVDKEKEIQTLLPSYSYLHNKSLVPKLVHLLKLWPTIKNLLYLSIIKTNIYEKLFTDLKSKIETVQHGAGVPAALQQFLVEYELIFETNLLAGLAVKKMNFFLKNEPVHFADLLAAPAHFIDLKKYNVHNLSSWQGNSLELIDESDFLAMKQASNEFSDVVRKWWQQVLGYKKKVIQDAIVQSIIYNRLRELGRWLTVKNSNALRTALLGHADKKEFKDVKNIFFAKLKDVLEGRAEESRCQENKNEYQKHNQWELPSSLTSRWMQKESDTQGVSAGVARGIVQNQETLKLSNSYNEKVILYTEILSPDLTQYFPRISGIISNNGGLLSHLAIVAREQKIPVVVGCRIEKSSFTFGDQVQINGSSGEIIKL